MLREHRAKQKILAEYKRWRERDLVGETADFLLWLELARPELVQFKYQGDRYAKVSTWIREQRQSQSTI